MSDPWGNIQNFMNDFRQLTSNPREYTMRKMRVSEDIANNPDAIIQKMMSEGKVSQAQYDSARRAAHQIQNNPMFRQFFKI